MKRRAAVLAVLSAAAVVALIAVSVVTDDAPRDRPGRPVTRAAGPPPHRPRAALAGYQFPNRETTGVPAGWTPRETRSDDLEVTEPGTVVEDVRFTDGASIVVRAPDVTIRRVDMQGGIVTNEYGTSCATGLVIEDTTFEPEKGHAFGANTLPVIGEGGYVARRVQIWMRAEGFRASDCGPVTVTDSFAYIQGDTPDCGRDLHSDGVQGVYAKGMTIRDSTLIFGNPCGTSPYFMPYGDTSQPPMNTGRYIIDRLLVGGGGYVFRQGVPASVTGLRIIDRSWVYGPIDVWCPDMSPWEAKLVKVDANYQVTRVVRDQRCDTRGRN